MTDIEDFIPVINGHLEYFGSKRGIKNWYPKNRKDQEDFLENLLKTYPEQKTKKNKIKDFLDRNYAQTVEEEMTLRAKEKDRDHEPWFTKETKKLWEDKIFTNSQFAFYRKKFEGELGRIVCRDLDDSTNEILTDLEKPTRPGKWESKGMVVGDVQSGKTSNYIGLIAKAIDCGYKLIIVMSGIYNSLRAQTQTRLMENLISTSDQQGKDVFKVNFMTHKPKYKFVDGIKEMDINGDFNAKTAQTVALMPNLDPAIFVIKKNVPVLSNILIWLNGQPGIKKDPKKPWTWRGFRDLIADKLPEHQILCDLPLLIIDDECDSASIDISKRKGSLSDIDDKDELEHFRLADPSKTNLLIRRIMASFTKNAYIGYTATPLANIFIDYTSIKKQEGRDLFPRDFVKILKRYNTYQSPLAIFGKAERNFDDNNEIVSLSEDIDDEKYLQVKWIYDYRDDFDEFVKDDGEIDNEKRDEVYRKEGTRGEEPPTGWLPLYHKQFHNCPFKNEEKIPLSLENAINTFLINIAIKSLRNVEINHNSMLIHVSRFVSVQNTVKKQVKDYVKNLKNIIQNDIDNKKINAVKNRFEKIWKEDTLKTLDASQNIGSNTIDFNEVWKKITETLVDEEKFDIVQINSNSADILDYENKKKGWNVIVIGGAAISRGLTLEGLSVSYFLRVAKTPVADTLIQMGRWFGYRRGYEDLYRIYVPKILHILFRQFTYAMEFARGKFGEMQIDRRSPIEFSMEIPTFPGWNLIAASKSKDLIVLPEPLYSYNSRHHVNIEFYSEEGSRSKNISLANKLVDNLGKNEENEKEINERINNAKIWLPGKISSRIDHNLEKSEIIKNIKKIKKENPISKAYLWKDIDCNEIVKFLLTYQKPRKPFSDSHPHDIAYRINLLNQNKPEVKWNFAIWSLKEDRKDRLKLNIGNKLKYKITIPERSINKEYKQGKEFSIGELADPISEFMDMDKETFDKGVDHWIEVYRSTGKTEEKKGNYLPFGFKQRVRGKRKEGFFILTPWSVKSKDNNKDANSKKKADIHISWEVIIPSTKEEKDDENLVYNVALNRVALEHRRQNLMDFLNMERGDEAA